MRKIIATLAVVGILVGIAAIAASASTPRVTWKVGASRTVTIRHGGRVTWVWAGDAQHDVRGKGFHSGFHTKRGTTYTHTFKSKGTFKIVCDVHPGAMKTVVKVT